MDFILNNRYRIIQPLGKGGFGETFLSEDTHMPSARKCVVKQLRPASNDPTVFNIMKDRFQREAAILEVLGRTSDQIPELYASFTETDKFYLVQELIEGETLTQRIMRDGPFDEKTVKDLIQSLLLVLESVHSRGIIHRDIKPDNIMIRQADGVPVLIDFGAVKEIVSTIVDSRGNPTSTIAIGSPGFMPLEQAAGKPVFGSDLYSLGLTAVYLLTGVWPQVMTDPTTGDVNWQQQVPGVSTEFATVINKAIESHFRDRFKTAREMLSAMNNSGAQVHRANLTAPEPRMVQPTNPAMQVTPLPAEQFRTFADDRMAKPSHSPQATTAAVTQEIRSGLVPLEIPPVIKSTNDSRGRKSGKAFVVATVVFGVLLLAVAGTSIWYYRNHRSTPSVTATPATELSASTTSVPSQPTATQTPRGTQTPSPLPPEQIINVAGKWKIVTVLRSNDKDNGTFVLQQNGNSITGYVYSDGTPKETFPLNGTITGNRVRLISTHKFTQKEMEENKTDGELAGAKYASITLTGTTDGKTMTGSLTTRAEKKAVGSGSWSATKS